MPRKFWQSTGQLRRRFYNILEHGTIGERTGRFVGRFIVFLIILNLIAVTLELVPEYQARYQVFFTIIELFSLVVFTVEYALRVWVASEHTPHRHLSAASARWNYVRSAFGLIDLIAVLPFWFAFALPPDLRVLMVLRMLRFLKLGRYSPGMRSLLDAVFSERRALFACMVILMGATLFSATIMHLAERNVQPDKLGTIPDAMWWAIVTLGTIGYGDVVPVTMLGRIIASVTIFTGLVMVALPVGIIATAFASHIHRRDFVITWSMVARVPLFAELKASDIADIMDLLRAQQVTAGAVIARRGEPAHSMYFIAAGEVEIELKHERVRLAAGHFFGEVAVLRRARRSATASAVTRTSLLVLEAEDLHALMEREPLIAERIREAVRSRLGRDIVTPKGDLVTEELEEA